MSDTPRTDGARMREKNGCVATFQGVEIVPAKFAEKLERKLAEAQKDTARMDWLDKQHYAEFGDGEAGELSLHILDFEDFTEWHGRGTARDCIDAAMEAQNK